MNWNFALSRAQLEAFYKCSGRRLAARARSNYKLLGINILAWIAVGIGVSAFVSLYRKAPELTEDLHLVAICIAVAIAVFWGELRYRRRMLDSALLADDCFIRGPQSVTAGSEGLEIVGPGPDMRSQVNWGQFRDLDEDDSGLYFFLDAYNAIILPKSVLSAGDLERLRERVRQAKDPGTGL